MNRTSASKVTKKKPKIKEKSNKSTGNKIPELALCHSLQKLQQQEENIVKKKVKNKQISDIKPAVVAVDHAVQKYHQDEVKFVNKKQISNIVDTSGAALGQQQQQNDKFIQNVKQTYNKSTDIETTEVTIGHSLQKAKQQQPHEERCVKENPKVNNNSKKSSDIKTAETAVSHALQQQQHEVEYYREKAYIFMKTLKRDYKRLGLIYNSCIKAEQERERQNVVEIDQLKKVYNHMQAERTDIKRKRWCRYCESEATYLCSAGMNFYCSQGCEQKQNDLVSAMEETSKP